MKYLILTLIQFYWWLVPISKRKKCIFHTSCSNHVYEHTRKYGAVAGYAALVYRFKNCREGYELYHNPVNDQLEMILPSGDIIDRSEIAERLYDKG